MCKYKHFFSKSFWSYFWLLRAPLKDLCIKCLYLHIKNSLCEKCRKKDWKMFSNCLGSFLLRQTYSSTSRNKFTNVERTWKYNFRGGVTTLKFLLVAILDSSVTYVVLPFWKDVEMLSITMYCNFDQVLKTQILKLNGNRSPQ